jgi:hypothetical protein
VDFSFGPLHQCFFSGEKMPLQQLGVVPSKNKPTNVHPPTLFHQKKKSTHPPTLFHQIKNTASLHTMGGQIITLYILMDFDQSTKNKGELGDHRVKWP